MVGSSLHKERRSYAIGGKIVDDGEKREEQMKNVIL